MDDLSATIFGYDGQDLDLAALLTPPPSEDVNNDAGEWDDWTATLKRRAAWARFTRETEGDAPLEALRRTLRDRAALEEQSRLLVAFMRDRAAGRYTLQDLADVLGISISGVRRFYDESDTELADTRIDIARNNIEIELRQIVQGKRYPAPSEYPALYVDAARGCHPAAVLDRRPQGGYVFVEYVRRDGTKVVECVKSAALQEGESAPLPDCPLCGGRVMMTADRAVFWCQLSGDFMTDSEGTIFGTEPPVARTNTEPE